MKAPGCPTVIVSVAMVALACTAATAQYRPGDLVTSGHYSPITDRTTVLGMAPNGSISTVAHLPGSVREIMPSPDNRSLWAYTSSVKRQWSEIRAIAPDGSHKTVLKGDRTLVIRHSVILDIRLISWRPDRATKV